MYMYINSKYRYILYSIRNMKEAQSPLEITEPNIYILYLFIITTEY